MKKILLVLLFLQITITAFSQSVVINKYFNTGVVTGDAIELLVITNNLDMRGMIVKDFSASMGSDNGGKYTFTTDALWASVQSGTLIVLRKDGSSADVVAGGSDFNLDLGLDNATYFTNGGGSFDISTTDMIMIKSAGSGIAGVTGSIHILAGGTAGSQFTSALDPRLRSTATAGTNQFVYANNSTSSISDYNGTDATGAATGLTLGSANNITNDTYIQSLRAAVLPVTLTSFTGKKQTKGVQLNWATASEKNNSYFEVLRSTDGKTFRSVAKVNGNGNSDAVHNYSYTDQSPFAGTNYYQLNQFDFDGKNTKSAVVAVTVDLNKSAFHVYASKEESEIEVSVYSSTNTNAQFTVFNASGRKLLNQTLSLSQGLNLVKIAAPQMQAGLNIATLSTATENLNLKFIK